MRTVFTLLLIWTFAGLIAFAGSSGSYYVGPVPLFAACIALAFLVQWLAFIPSWGLKTEKFYDLTGGATYVLLMVAILLVVPGAEARPLLLAALVGIWAIRLSGFLFMRIRHDGFDRRFDKIKTRFWSLFITWNLQALWISVTAGAAMAAMSTSTPVELGVPAVLGFVLWLIGFMIESTADAQKRRFRERSREGDAFIREGLWAYSQHPNYFGEIVLWTGIALIALPALNGASYITLVSPLFVYLLLTKISGIPLLDASAKKRWGQNPDYKDYISRTSKLVPRRPKSATAD